MTAAGLVMPFLRAARTNSDRLTVRFAMIMLLVGSEGYCLSVVVRVDWASSQGDIKSIPTLMNGGWPRPANPLAHDRRSTLSTPEELNEQSIDLIRHVVLDPVAGVRYAFN